MANGYDFKSPKQYEALTEGTPSVIVTGKQPCKY